MSDHLFKRIFGQEKEIMMELINAVIKPDYPVVELEYIQTELLPEHENDKLTIVDVRCRDNINRHFIVEMQVILKRGFHERVFYNATKVYGKQISSGDDTRLLQPVYAISFINGTIEPLDESWLHRYQMMKKNGVSSSLNAITLIFVEIPKFIKFSKFDMDDPLHRWIRFLAEPEYINALHMERKHNYPNLKKAVEILDEASLSPAQQRGYDQYLDSIRYWNGTMIESYDNGFDEGLEKGRKEATKNLESALSDLKNGISIEDVAAKYSFEKEYIEFLYQKFIAL